MRLGDGIHLTSEGAGHPYRNGLGEGDTNSGEPPKMLVAAEEAFQQYRLGERDVATCSRLAKESETLSSELRRLAEMAIRLAHVKLLSGDDCQFISADK